MSVVARVIAVVLLGRPGSGKGTQAQMFAAAGWRHINVGGLVRARVAEDTAWGRRAARLMLHGELLPSRVIYNLLANELSRGGGFPVVIEGYPRRLKEADAIASACEPGTTVIPVLMDLSRDLCAERLKKRQTCVGCGWVARVQRGASSCGRCAGLLVSRDDDRSQTVLNRRFEIFDIETAPLLDFYMTRGDLIVVDSACTEDAVHATIVEKITARLSVS